MTKWGLLYGKGHEPSTQAVESLQKTPKTAAPRSKNNDKYRKIPLPPVASELPNHPWVVFTSGTGGV